MKRFFYILAVALLCGALSCPSVEAQSRGRNNGNNGGGNTTTTHNSGGQSRGSQNTRPATPKKDAAPVTRQTNNNNKVDANRVNSAGSRPMNNNSQATRPGSSTSTPTSTPATRPGNNGFGNGQGNTPSAGAGNNHTRPGNGVNNSSNGNGNRPGGNDSKPGNGNKPGNNTKPNGNPPGNNFAPGGGPGNGGHGPGNGGHNPGGPGHNPGYGPGHGGHNPGGPGHGPGPGHSWSHIPNYAPYRPMMPPPRPFWRPTPPPSFRPGPRYPIISTILGVTIGTAINLSLDYLYNQGYYITGYTNDAVYLNDVTQLNLIWPNATLYYERGRLAGSEFVYSTPYYDMTRYYNTYNRLLNAYGAPIVTNMLPNGGMECSWFGYDGQYVTLQFVNALASNGYSRYYTTLSFGR